jgi:hypothetical protein
MNKHLQNLFEQYYRPELAPVVEQRGSSSIQGTGQLRSQLPDLFKKYKISSMFDAGCNDYEWANLITDIEYHGGDISQYVVNSAICKWPNANITVHDMTEDVFPDVDLLFVRDVAIHLSDIDRKKLLNNWLTSSIPWLLITHIPDASKNNSIQYQSDEFPASDINWLLPPWNFPQYTDCVWEFNPGGRCMALWHQDHIKSIL